MSPIFGLRTSARSATSAGGRLVDIRSGSSSGIASLAAAAVDAPALLRLRFRLRPPRVPRRRGLRGVLSAPSPSEEGGPDVFADSFVGSLGSWAAESDMVVLS